MRWKPSEHLEQGLGIIWLVFDRITWRMCWGQNDWGQGWKQSCRGLALQLRDYGDLSRNRKAVEDGLLVTIIWIWSHSPVVSLVCIGPVLPWYQLGKLAHLCNLVTFLLCKKQNKNETNNSSSSIIFFQFSSQLKDIGLLAVIINSNPWHYAPASESRV